MKAISPALLGGGCYWKGHMHVWHELARGNRHFYHQPATSNHMSSNRPMRPRVHVTNTQELCLLLPQSCVILCGHHHQPHYYNTMVKLFLSISLARKWSNIWATNSFHLQKKKDKCIFEGNQHWHESIFSKMKNVRTEALQRKDWGNKMTRNPFPQSQEQEGKATTKFSS